MKEENPRKNKPSSRFALVGSRAEFVSRGLIGISWKERNVSNPSSIINLIPILLHNFHPKKEQNSRLNDLTSHNSGFQFKDLWGLCGNL